MPKSSRFAVAVHTLAVIDYLQRHGDSFVCSDAIAKSVNTNPVMIRNLLCLLKKAKLIEAKEGKGGGARLARRSGDITLFDIYTAVEGDEFLTKNFRPEKKGCPISCHIKGIMDPIFREVEDSIERSLRQRTLAHVMKQIPAPAKQAAACE